MIKLNIKNELTAGLQAAAKAMPKARDKGLKRAGLALWDDTVNISPKPPIDTGLLRGSGNLFVSGKKIDEAPPSVDRNRAADAGGEPTKPGELLFALNVPYAARQHELPEYHNHNRPEANADSGPQFVRFKIQRFGKDYMRIIADTMKETF